MKIDLIQYILQNSFMTNFQERFRDESGAYLEPEEALHLLMMEYAKVVNGGESNIVTVPRTSAGHSDD